MLELVSLFPHPPIVVPEVGKSESGKVKATYDAMDTLAQDIKKINPQLVVAITPHGHVFSDAVTITALKHLEGNLSQFGAAQVKVSFNLDCEAVDAIITHCRDRSFPCVQLDENVLRQYRRPLLLDHGLVVPLTFLAQSGWKGKLVPVNVGLLSYEELYHFGILLKQSLDSLGRVWVLLVSGDMSHCLLPQAPAGFSPQGAVFDEIIRQCIREGDVKRLFSLDPELVEEAAECGLRPLVMALGALDGYLLEPAELSYEAPFGVGYLVAKLKAGEKMASREIGQVLYKEKKERLYNSQVQESLPVKLARASIANYLQKGKYLEMPGEAEVLKARKAGAFVSLKKHGRLRGCIGTIEPVQENLGKEIIYNAVSAAFHDPRFEPLEIEELDDLSITVDVLEEPEKIKGMDDLDPRVYGVIVTSGSKKGLLLPDLAGINTPAEQVRIAGEKAGIKPGEPVTLQRFRVTRYT